MSMGGNACVWEGMYVYVSRVIDGRGKMGHCTMIVKGCKSETGYVDDRVVRAL